MCKDYNMAFELDCKYFPYCILLIAVAISLYCPEKFAFLNNPCMMLLIIAGIIFCAMKNDQTLGLIALTTVMFVSSRYQMKMCENLKSIGEKFEQFDPSSESTLE